MRREETLFKEYKTREKEERPGEKKRH